MSYRDESLIDKLQPLAVSTRSDLAKGGDCQAVLVS